MDAILTRIRRIGHILQIFCKVALVILKIRIITCIVIAIGSLFVPNFVQDVDVHLDTIQMFQAVEDLIDLSPGMTRLAGFLTGLIGAVSSAVLYFVVSILNKLMLQMADGKQPFTIENAKQLRKISYFSLILVLANPLLAATLFLVMLLVSYLFEYGAYLQKKAELTNRIQEEMIVSFAEITENKSGQTGQHIKRVSEYSKILARQMGLSEEEVAHVRLASTMHDIGKLLVPSEILEKPARLTDEEYAEIKKHTTYGGQLLDHVEGDVMDLARQIALEHHERVDGRGYPSGKMDASISLEGRIVAVADVYDALTSRRSYKDAWDDSAAYAEIVKNAGSQFDPQVVKAFKASYDAINAVRMEFAD